MHVIRLFDPSEAAGQSSTIETVSDVVARYLREKSHQVEIGSYSAKSLETLTYTMKDFCSACGSFAVSGCTNTDLVDWIRSHAGWVSPHTKVHRMGFVVSCFKWAAKRRLIDRCPFERESNLWPTAMPREAILPDEFHAIMQTARFRPKCGGRRGTRQAFRRALAFLWETGARTCEMKECRWLEVDLEAGTIILDKSKTGQATGQKRIIALTPKIVRLLTWIKRRKRPKLTDRVFPNGRGDPWSNSTFGKLFRKIARKAGVRLKVTAYSLRHGFCVRALESGIVSDRQIADVMGHETTRQIAWYGRSARTKTDYLRATLAKIKPTKPKPKR